MDSLSTGHQPTSLSGGKASRVKVQRQGAVILEGQVPPDGNQPAPFTVTKRPEDHRATDFDSSSKDASLFATL